MKTIYVLLGTGDEFNKFIAEREMEKGQLHKKNGMSAFSIKGIEYKRIVEARDLAGVRNIKVERYGRWEQRADIEEMETYITLAEGDSPIPKPSDHGLNQIN